MIVYSSTKEQFTRDVVLNQIELMVSERSSEKLTYWDCTRFTGHIE